MKIIMSHHHQQQRHLGFICVDSNTSLMMSTSLSTLRESVDELLRELNPSFKAFEYKFIDRNSWPVLSSQESYLSLVDLLDSKSCIGIQFVCDDEATMKLGFNSSQGLPSSGSKQQSLMAIQDDPNQVVLRRKQQDCLMMPQVDDPMLIDSVDHQKSVVLKDEENKMKSSPKKSSLLSRKLSNLSFRNNSNKSSIKAIKDNKSAKHFVMLSYARNEAAHHALLLKTELDKLGVATYLDVHEITSGSDWQDSLNYAVNNCVVFVPLVTPMYGNTQWTNREVKLADILKKKIVPINFLESWPPECLAIQFATTQYISWLSHDSLEVVKSLDFKTSSLWPEGCVKNIAALLANQVPKSLSSSSKTTTAVVKKEGTTTTTTTSILSSMSRSSKYFGNQITIESSITGDNNMMTTTSSSSSSPSTSVVISGHPSDLSVINKIRYSLEAEGFSVWCSCDDRLMMMNVNDEEGEDQIDRLVPNSSLCLPTITEGQTHSFTEAYKEIARNLVAAKQQQQQTVQYYKQSDSRPLSTPSVATASCSTPTVQSTAVSASLATKVVVSRSENKKSLKSSSTSSSRFQSMINMDSSSSRKQQQQPKAKYETIKRMHSDVNQGCSSLSSLTPETRLRLEIFGKKVAESAVVIIVSSQRYFESSTSKEQVFYCETRKKMIVVKVDEEETTTASCCPPWFNNLMGIQLEVVSVLCFCFNINH